MGKSLIIFDCDGVLMDSEVISCKGYSMTLKEFDFDVETKEIVTRFTGMTNHAIKSVISKEHGKPVPKAFDEKLKENQLKALKEGLVIESKMKNILANLNVDFCIASGSDYERLDLTLDIVGLKEFFNKDNVFSSYSVERGKPYPDIFLYAAKKMSKNAKESIVIEDSVNGVKAGKSANMFTVGYIGGSHCQEGHDQKLMSAGADVICKTLEELEETIKRLV